MNVKTLFVTLMIGGLIVACSPVGGGQSEPVRLDGTNWELSTLNEEALLDGTTITATFSEGEITGSSGCNSYFGSYTLDGSDLSFGTIGMTEMACLEPEGVMEQEMTYLETLQSAAVVHLVDNQLEMLDASGEVILRFEKK